MTRYKREPTCSTTAWRCSKSGRTSAQATLSCTILFASANVTRCTARVILIDSNGRQRQLHAVDVSSSQRFVQLFHAGRSGKTVIGPIHAARQPDGFVPGREHVAAVDQHARRPAELQALSVVIRFDLATIELETELDRQRLQVGVGGLPIRAAIKEQQRDLHERFSPYPAVDQLKFAFSNTAFSSAHTLHTAEGYSRPISSFDAPTDCVEQDRLDRDVRASYDRTVWSASAAGKNVMRRW